MWTELLVPMFPVRTIGLRCSSKSKCWLLNPIVSRCLFDTFVCFGFIPQQTLNSDWHSVLLVLWLVSMTTDLKKQNSCGFQHVHFLNDSSLVYLPQPGNPLKRSPQGDSTFSATQLWWNPWELRDSPQLRASGADAYHIPSGYVNIAIENGHL